jgi:GEVED domain/Dockerin type I domain/Bacterial pre-peptidase C-terminal domain
MAIGGLSTSRNLLARKRLHKRAIARRILLETLELRQLMAVGPQLLGIQPNSGELLTNGQILNTSPRELVFRFNDGAGIDASTLSGIRVIRSGEDGVFERASVATDFGTNGQTLVEFYAQETGETGNGIQIQFTRVSRQDSRRPVISVSGQVVTIQLNSNPNLETRVEDLLQALDPNATTPTNSLIYALRLRGLQTAPIAQTANTTRLFTLGGANSAKTTTSFGLSSSLQVRLVAVESGNAGIGTVVTVTGRDRGGAGTPIVTGSGMAINVEINTNSRFPTTVQEFVDALNSSSVSSGIVRAELVSGLGATRLGTAAITYSPLTLTGVLDVEVIPAYVGLGDSNREVVMRFAETLPDDKYRIEILGQGTRALRNASGDVFNNGVSRTVGFELDLGAQVESIVPQPVTRNTSGQLVQQRNQIDVYFNNDDLINISNVVSVNGFAINTLRGLRNPLYFQNGDSIVFSTPASSSVVNTSFYQLIHTAGTLSNTDDTTILPISVRYYPETDRVTLNFSRNLDELVSPVTNLPLAASELRLRVGTNQALPVPPIQVTPAADPGDTFATAQNLNTTWTPGVSGSQSVVIDSAINNTTPFNIDFPGAADDPGNRQIRLQSLLRLAGDTVNGTSVIFYNFQGQLGTSAFNSTVQLNAITEVQKQRVREVFSIYEQYLGVRFVESTNRGLTVAVGDTRAVTPFEDILGSGISGIVTLNGEGSTVYESGVLSNGQLATVLDTQDFSDSTVNGFAGPFQRGVMQGIGRLLGLGLSDEVAQLTIQSANAIFAPGVGTEIVLPGDADIVHGQYLYRPDSRDIDLYQFKITAPGKVTIETFAERLSEASLLDTQIRLYKKGANGGWEEIAANDDYNSSDSLVEVELGAGNYIVGVSSSGNSDYDPTIADSGLGGRSEGNYKLRMDYRAPATDFIRDATGTAFDGDADGLPGGSYDFWFRASGPGNTKFVDKSVTTSGSGTLLSPYKNIKDALAAAVPGDVVRIVGNGGADGKLSTAADNLAYEIGFDSLGRALQDGSTLDVPKNVTVQIDAGAILKLRRSRIGVGSTSTNVDRSAGTLMVLGTPLLLDSTGNAIKDSAGVAIPGSVYLTSAADTTLGKNANQSVVGTTPTSGDWGGIDFRNRVDAADATRRNLEASGLFMNSISHADIRYGGGQVVVDGVSQVVAPVQMIDARPTIVFSQISSSADAAMAASPNSFLESNFQSPLEQGTSSFTTDYSRIGPEIHGNRLTKNSINGLQIRVRTGAGTQVEKLTVQARFDDTDIVHVIPENLEIEGTPGGAIQKVAAPSSALVTLTEQVGGTLAAGSYNYRFTFIDANGQESPASEPTDTLSTFGNTSIVLQNVPQGARKIYRSTGVTTDPFGFTIGAGPYVLVAQLPAATATFIDNGSTLGTLLSDATPAVVSRLDARLKIDAGSIVKFKGSRLDVTMGAQLIAEGDANYPVVFTSLNDARYGAGGTFDTANRVGSQSSAAGDWGGVYVGHTSKASLDHAVVAYGGGTTRIDGGFADFNALEVHQGTLRVANSRLELNGSGAATSTDAQRGGKGTNSAGTIFARAAQPIIVNNIILNNGGAAISANLSALNASYVTDTGRTSGTIQRMEDTLGNQGPLVRGNRLDGNFYNGMIVRGGQLTTAGVWDDTDMVHVVLDEIIVPDFHEFGGLKLESSPTASLVVKLRSGTNVPAGFTATGAPLDNANRVGGSVQIVGAPGQPVVLTSLFDCTVGAGFTPTGEAQKATDLSCVAQTGEEIVDVVLLLDDTGSFAGTGPEVAKVFDRIVNYLTTNLPDSDFAFSVTRFEDYAGVGGGATDRPFILNQPLITANTPGFNAAITSALNRTAPGGGGDLPESAIEGLWQIATGLGFDGNNDNDTVDSGRAGLVTTQTNPGGGGDVPAFSSFAPDPAGPVLASAGNIGGVGFRANSTKRLVLLATDAGTAFEPDSVDPYIGKDGIRVPASTVQSGSRGTTPNNRGASIQRTVNALVSNNIQVIGLADNSFNSGVQPFLTGMAQLTGAVSNGGTPMVYNIQNTTSDQLANTIVTAITNSVIGAAAGDWRSVLLSPFSNDRNVASVTENEANSAISATANDSTAAAQYLGRIAPNLLAGDENQRLGFEIQGVISKPSDVDVYSFNADAGTEVWFDIDKTQNSLDTIIELVDADGRTLALSNDSLAEENNPSLLFQAPELGAQKVHGLRKSSKDFYATSAFGTPKDLYSTNPRDAGLRVVLPGQVGENNLYHVRVRSSNLAPTDPASKLLDANQVTAGLTKGNYQLQLRLREVDEIPGSSVNYADIRFAQSGVRLVGVPGNSPLLGENSEAVAANDPLSTVNSTRANAQALGNLLTSNRQAISVAGNLDSFTDVDWFSFSIDHQKVTPTGLRQYFATILDVDYGDGIGRPDVSAYVFDSAGNLILGGLGSNLVDDQANPIRGADSGDLTRGSAGGLDPYIGAYELPGGTYFVAITNSQMVPSVLATYTDPNASAATAAIRMQPIEGVAIIGEDHVNSSNAFNTSNTAPVPVVFPTAGTFDFTTGTFYTAANDSIIDFGLADLSLYVSQDVGTELTNVYVVNPFTGETKAQLGRVPRDLGDIAIRDNGSLNAFDRALERRNANNNQDTEVEYLSIDTGTGATNIIGTTGMVTNHLEFNAGTPSAVASNDGFNPEAITFSVIGGDERGFMVGNRPTPPGFEQSYTVFPGDDTFDWDTFFRTNPGQSRPGPSYFTNVLYEFNENTGVPTSDPAGDKQNLAVAAGAGTAIRERGYIETLPAAGQAATLLVAREVTTTRPGQTPLFVIRDGDSFQLVDSSGFAVGFEFDLGPEVLVNYDPANGRFVRDGMTFSLDGTTYEFDTGSVVVISALNGSQVLDSSTVRIRNLAGVERIFEFDLNGQVVGGSNIPVRITAASTQAQIAQALASAINATASFGVTASVNPNSNRVSLGNASTTQPATVTGAGITVSGFPGVGGANVRIPILETSSLQSFLTAIDQATPNSITVSYEGGRMNFSGATTGSFADLTFAGIFTDVGSSGGTAGGNIGIKVLAGDTAETVAARITLAINTSGIPGLSASVSGKEVQLAGGAISDAGELIAAGLAPGGIIRGIAVINGTMYAVSDKGGLFSVFAPTALRTGNVGNYIQNSYDLLGINFTGLVAGPTHVSGTTPDGTPYSQLLFGIDVDGVMHAFNTQGRLQPVFANGATSIATGLPSATGLALSTLDFNLWHVSSQEPVNGGANQHGVPPTTNDTRIRQSGGSSLYFGYEGVGANSGTVASGLNDLNGAGAPGANNNINFPGGAAGAIESAPFSLNGLASADLPTLYFNYYFETEQAGSAFPRPTNAADYMRDSLRVYISGDSGEWIKVATNNSDRTANLDEFDIQAGNVQNQVQELFDNNGRWRQARIPLDAFAGQENVKIRIEFASAGGFGYGFEGGRGPEIRTIAGNKLADGATMSIHGQTFEIEMGVSVTLPGGSSIRNGDSLTIDGRTFVFTNGTGPAPSAPNIAVPFTATMTAEQITAALVTAINTSSPSRPVVTGLDLLNEGNDVITAASLTGITGDTVRVTGSGAIGDNPVYVEPGRDVDMIRLDLDAGASVTVSVEAASSALDSFLRVFDAEGRVLRNAFGGAVENDNRVGSFDSLVTFTAATSGTYYIGVSGAGNQLYNPTVAINSTTGSTGAYNLVIDVTRQLAPVQNANRLQLKGAKTVTASAGSNLLVQGTFGSTGTAVNVEVSMTSQQVAQALRTSIANFFAGGATNVYPIRGGNTLDLTGLVEYDSFDFFTGLNVPSAFELDAGPFGASTIFEGDLYSAFNAGTNFDGSTNTANPGYLAGQNNNVRGVYLDDFIIGIAGRGEMILDATGGTDNFVVDPQLSLTVPTRPNPEILAGPYQFELRGGDGYGIPLIDVPPVRLLITENFASDQRLAPGISVRFNSASQMIAGETFTLSDGTTQLTFEMDDVNDGRAVQAGNIAIPFNSAALDPVSGTRRSETAQEIAGRVRDIINSPLVQSQFKLTANLLNNDRTTASSSTVVFDSTATVNVPTSIGQTTITKGIGTQNRERLQGQIVISNSRISNSSGFGASIEPGPRDAVTRAPVSGSPRNTITLNTERLAPGAVIMNSEFLFNQSGGINIQGDPLTAGVPAAAVPFVRLVNNTIVGGSLSTPNRFTPQVYDDQFFNIGNLAFADTAVSYNPTLAGGPGPTAGLNVSFDALGAPNFSGTGEPIANQGVVSLGRGGQLVVQFTDNLLTGSGNGNPDLVIFEVGDSEEVLVEVSADGNRYTAVGRASAASPTIDIDAFGYNTSSRIAFVRLTDVANQGSQSGNSVGADIDAIGALSSVAADNYLPGGQGIRVVDNATATILNSVIINSGSGIHVDASSASTVVGGTTFQYNVNNVSGSATVGQFSTTVANNIPVFVDVSTGNLYPAPSSPIIDSSIDSLQDRPSLVAVKQPLGISASPILAPQFDSNGQLRVDDPAVETPSGLGNNIFKDRGAQDRADFVGPSVLLVQPVDNDVQGVDTNPDVSVVELTGRTLQYFDIQLFDGILPSDPAAGSKVNPASVQSSSILVYRDGIPLVDGVDYTFGYNSTSGIIRLQPLAGIWQSESAYTIRFINTNESSIVATAGALYTDGKSFDIIDISGSRTSFEFDTGYTISVPTTAGGLDANIVDGSTFTIDDGVRRFTFEFDSNDSSSSTNLVIPISSANPTPDSVVQAMLTAFAATSLRATVTNLGNGKLQIQGARTVQLLTNDSGLIVTGQPGVRTAFGLQIPLAAGLPVGVLDGQTFVIDRSGAPVTFEIDSDGIVTNGNLPVRIVSNANATQIGNALATAINSAALGLSATYIGDGFVRLGGDANTRLDLTNTVLQQSGIAGSPAAIAIPISAQSTNSAVVVATLIKQIIDAQNLPGIETTQFGSRVVIEGARGVAGEGVGQISGVRDNAGNVLKPNQADGTTILTIFLGEGLDYGDAADPKYASTKVNNGPRHTVVSGLSLGVTVTPDADAKLTDLDSDDGVTFGSLVAGFGTSFTVNVTNTTGSTAYLSYWIDYNGDGVFGTTEGIVQSTVTTANTTFTVTVPGKAAVGQTYARFRVSTDRASVATPTGAAPDGEVEDHAVRIQANPYKNPSTKASVIDSLGNNLDVNADGFVSPIDVLQLIAYLNSSKPRELTLPVTTTLPPYVDVNGDATVSPIDVLLVIDFLSKSRSAGSGEGEASLDMANDLSVDLGTSQEMTLASNWMPALVNSVLGTRPETRVSAPVVSFEANNDDALLKAFDEDDSVINSLVDTSSSWSNFDEVFASAGEAESDLLDVSLNGLKFKRK